MGFGSPQIDNDKSNSNGNDTEWANVGLQLLAWKIIQ